MHDLLAHSGLLKGTQAPDDLAGVQSQTGGRAVSRQRIGHIVASHRRNFDHESSFLVVLEDEAHAVVFLLDGQSADVRALVAQAEPDRADMGGQLGLPQEGVIAVQDQRCAVGQTRTNLQLGLADILLTAQIADMRHADAGDDAHIRAGALAQALDLAQMAHAHLDDGIFGILPDAEHRPGQPQLVVLVALGLDGIAEALNGGIAHLFGGGLAHAAGHAHHFGVELAAVVRTHDHHRMVAVGAHDGLFRRDALHRVVHDHAERTVFQRLGGKIMAVEFFPGESHKDAAGADLAAVGGHKGHFRVSEVQSSRCKSVEQDACLDVFHCLSPLYPHVMVTIVPRWTLEPAASLCSCTRPFSFPATTQFSPAAASIWRAKSALLPVTSGTSVCFPS